SLSAPQSDRCAREGSASRGLREDARGILVPLALSDFDIDDCSVNWVGPTRAVPARRGQNAAWSVERALVADHDAVVPMSRHLDVAFGTTDDRWAIGKFEPADRRALPPPGRELSRSVFA